MHDGTVLAKAGEHLAKLQGLMAGLQETQLQCEWPNTLPNLFSFPAHSVWQGREPVFLRDRGRGPRGPRGVL